MTTMLLIPANVDPVIDGPWQSAHPLVMPAWSIFPPAKLVKPVSVEATWHEPHIAGEVRGIWLAGIPKALSPLWQVEQVLVSPRSDEWLNPFAGMNAMVEWQTSHDKLVSI